MKKNLRNLLILTLCLSLFLCACGGEAPKGNVSEGNELALGRMEGGVYTNTYAGLTCTLDESWEFYSAEELQEIPKAVDEMLEEDLENFEQIVDMQAENMNLGCVMSMNLTKLDLAGQLVAGNMDDTAIMEELLSQKDDLVAAYAQMGMEDVAMETKHVTFAGQERVGMMTTCTMQGAPVYIFQLQDYSRGAYGITLTFTSYWEDNTQTMLELFQAAE